MSKSIMTLSAFHRKKQASLTFVARILFMWMNGMIKWARKWATKSRSHWTKNKASQSLPPNQYRYHQSHTLSPNPHSYSQNSSSFLHSPPSPGTDHSMTILPDSGISLHPPHELDISIPPRRNACYRLYWWANPMNSTRPLFHSLVDSNWTDRTILWDRPTSLCPICCHWYSFGRRQSSLKFSNKIYIHEHCIEKTKLIDRGRIFSNIIWVLQILYILLTLL